MEAGSGLCIATVIKRTEKKRVVEVSRMITRGTRTKAQELLQMTVGCKEFNTSFIERLNGTMRERLASLTRKCRHAAQRVETLEVGMYLIGSTSTFCFPHHQLSKSPHFGSLTTPAMAEELTDHIWSIRELLMYLVTPVAWVQPKRRGRPRKHLLPDPSVPKRPRGRPRKVV